MHEHHDLFNLAPVIDAEHYSPVPLLRARAIMPVRALNISYRKVGGLRFIRIGKLCVSFCLTNKRV